MMKKMLNSALLGAILSVSVSASVDLASKKFDTKMIDFQKKMISQNKNYRVDNVSIDSKKMIDSKWAMYTFKLSLFDRNAKQKFISPMIIFTDGKYETNSLTSLATGERYEISEQDRTRAREAQIKKEERDKFEKNFSLNDKYYNKEHLISGNLNAKNKVVMISDPLCVACIGTFPSMYSSIKDKKDFAFFYYHFPLKGLHPTEEIVSKAMALASKKGVKNVESKIFNANLDRVYKADKKSVYKEKSNSYALSKVNKILGTSFSLKEVESVNLANDLEIAQDVRLRGTPTVILNGSLYHSRENLSKMLSK